MQELQLPEQRLWTRAEYDRAAEVGLFGADERLELIEGRIVRKMPQGGPHTTGVGLVEDALCIAFPINHIVRVQMPLALGEHNEPEPDIAVVPGKRRDYSHNHPASAVLVVEVADTSLDIDRTTKASLYARAGIADYWILNLQDRLLEVHRNPTPDSEQPLGHFYASVTHLAAGHSVSPLAAPHSIQVADLLP